MGRCCDILTLTRRVYPPLHKETQSRQTGLLFGVGKMTEVPARVPTTAPLSQSIATATQTTAMNHDVAVGENFAARRIVRFFRKTVSKTSPPLGPTSPPFTTSDEARCSGIVQRRHRDIMRNEAAVSIQRCFRLHAARNVATRLRAQRRMGQCRDLRQEASLRIGSWWRSTKRTAAMMTSTVAVRQRHSRLLESDRQQGLLLDECESFALALPNLAVSREVLKLLAAAAATAAAATRPDTAEQPPTTTATACESPRRSIPPPSLAHRRRRRRDHDLRDVTHVTLLQRWWRRLRYRCVVWGARKHDDRGGHGSPTRWVARIASPSVVPLLSPLGVFVWLETCREGAFLDGRSPPFPSPSLAAGQRAMTTTTTTTTTQSARARIDAWIQVCALQERVVASLLIQRFLVAQYERHCFRGRRERHLGEHRDRSDRDAAALEANYVRRAALRIQGAIRQCIARRAQRGRAAIRADNAVAMVRSEARDAIVRLFRTLVCQRKAQRDTIARNESNQRRRVNEAAGLIQHNYLSHRRRETARSERRREVYRRVCRIQAAWRGYLVRTNILPRVIFAVLQRRALKRINEAATLVQRHYRGHYVRRVIMNRAQEAARQRTVLTLALQEGRFDAVGRGYQARKLAYFLHCRSTAAVAIQRVFRGHLARVRRDILHWERRRLWHRSVREQAARHIQLAFHRYRQRCRLRDASVATQIRHRAAIIITRTMRRWVINKAFRAMRDRDRSDVFRMTLSLSASILQSRVRGNIARARVRHLREARSVIASVAYGFLVRRALAPRSLDRHRRMTAGKIASWWKDRRNRRLRDDRRRRAVLSQCLAQEVTHAATAVQRVFRGYIARRDTSPLRRTRHLAATKLQCFYRSYGVARPQLKQLRIAKYRSRAAAKIQSAWFAQRHRVLAIGEERRLEAKLHALETDGVYRLEAFHRRETRATEDASFEHLRLTFAHTTRSLLAFYTERQAKWMTANPLIAQESAAKSIQSMRRSFVVRRRMRLFGHPESASSESQTSADDGSGQTEQCAINQQSRSTTSAEVLGGLKSRSWLLWTQTVVQRLLPAVSEVSDEEREERMPDCSLAVTMRNIIEKRRDPSTSGVPQRVATRRAQQRFSLLLETFLHDMFLTRSCEAALEAQERRRLLATAARSTFHFPGESGGFATTAHPKIPQPSSSGLAGAGSARRGSSSTTDLPPLNVPPRDSDVVVAAATHGVSMAPTGNAGVPLFPRGELDLRNRDLDECSLRHRLFSALLLQEEGRPASSTTTTTLSSSPVPAAAVPWMAPLRTLRLDHNRLGDGSCGDIAAFMSSRQCAPSVRKVSLQGNRISDVGLSLIVAALRRTKALHRVELDVRGTLVSGALRDYLAASLLASGGQ